jgi:hypothetical protein
MAAARNATKKSPAAGRIRITQFPPQQLSAPAASAQLIFDVA